MSEIDRVLLAKFLGGTGARPSTGARLGGACRDLGIWSDRTIDGCPTVRDGTGFGTWRERDYQRIRRRRVPRPRDTRILYTRATTTTVSVSVGLPHARQYKYTMASLMRGSVPGAEGSASQLSQLAGMLQKGVPRAVIEAKCNQQGISMQDVDDEINKLSEASEQGGADGGSGGGGGGGGEGTGADGGADGDALVPPERLELFAVLCQRSQSTGYGFPTTANRLSNLCTSPAMKDAAVRHAETTRPLLPASAAQLCEDFLAMKREHGSEVEKRLYSELTHTDLLDRLITKRPLVFYTSADNYLLKSGTAASHHTANQQPPRTAPHRPALPHTASHRPALPHTASHRLAPPRTPSRAFKRPERRRPRRVGRRGLGCGGSGAAPGGCHVIRRALHLCPHGCQHANPFHQQRKPRQHGRADAAGAGEVRAHRRVHWTGAT